MFSLFRKQAPSLEDQIKTLAACGPILPAGFKAEHALSEWSSHEYQKNPYELLLIYLGGEYEEKPNVWLPRSSLFWHFDTECIEDTGDYVRIASRMIQLAQGGLPLENLSDEVEIEDKRAVLRFTLDGEAYEWPLTVDDDWIDVNLLGKLVGLYKKRGGDRTFFILQLPGQDTLVGCLDPQTFSKIRAVTGLKFVPF